MQRSIAWGLTGAVLVAALAFAATLVLGGQDARPAEAAAALPPAPASTVEDPRAGDDVASTAPADGPTSSPRSTSSAGSPTPGIGTSSARLADVEAAREPSPVGLHIDSIGVDDAPIDPVGVEPDGDMEIPHDIRRIGWYEYGPSPGEDVGSAVLTAHIDSREQGRGVFYHLDELAEGGTVEVAMSDGTVRSFEVIGTRQIPKVDLPTGELFRRDGQPVLALITCGGEFDSSSRHYQDNIVVLATPIG